MSILVGPQPGEKGKLNVTKAAQHRILIGLSWDENDLITPKEKRVQRVSSIKDILFGDIFLTKFNFDKIDQKMDTEDREENDSNFDLDLSCFIFNLVRSNLFFIGLTFTTTSAGF